MECGVGTDRGHAFPGRRIGLLEPGEHDQAGVVDQCVDPAEARDGELDDANDGVRLL
jgi:hypothetical protein